MLFRPFGAESLFLLRIRGLTPPAKYLRPSRGYRQRTRAVLLKRGETRRETRDTCFGGECEADVAELHHAPAGRRGISIAACGGSNGRKRRGGGCLAVRGLKSPANLCRLFEARKKRRRRGGRSSGEQRGTVTYFAADCESDVAEIYHASAGGRGISVAACGGSNGRKRRGRERLAVRGLKSPANLCRLFEARKKRRRRGGRSSKGSRGWEGQRMGGTGPVYLTRF